MAFYNVIFDRGVDHLFDYVGVGEAYAQSGVGSCFTMEVHLHYVQELSLGDDVEVHLQLLDYDAKRMHFFEQLYHQSEGYLAATSEQICMHVDMTTRRSAPFQMEALAKLEQLLHSHAELPVPDRVGHRIAIPEKS